MGREVERGVQQGGRKGEGGVKWREEKEKEEVRRLLGQHSPSIN